MKNFQSKIKSIVLIGLFVFLFVGFAFSTPAPAAASVDVVSTQITYHSQTINAELMDTVQATSEIQIVTDSLEVESTQLEATEDDDGWNWNRLLKWFKKTKTRFRMAFSLAWSG